MKKNILFLSIFLFIFLPKVYAEQIQTFNSEITINADGSLDVIESIRYDFGVDYRHGIYRTIPFVKTNSSGTRYKLTFTGFSVVQDDMGTAVPFSQEMRGTSIRLKIGDAKHTITGIHDYKISYHVRGAVTYFTDHDELVWNATGDQWEVPIVQSTAKIHLPSQSINAVTATCYIQNNDSKHKCSYDIRGATIIYTSDISLASYEGLQVVSGFPKGTVSVMEPEVYIEFWETLVGRIIKWTTIIASVIFGVFWYIVYPVWIPIRWLRFGRDPKPPMGVTQAWFSAPKTQNGRSLTPGETGTLVDECVDFSDVYATIVDLARRGYLKIKETKKNDFILIKNTQENTGILETFEQTFLNHIFRSTDECRIKNAHFDDAVSDIRKDLYLAVLNEKFFPKNPQSIRIYYSIVTLLSFVSLNIPLLFISVIFGRNMPKKTLLGAQEAAVGLSLKNFLLSQERKLSFQAKNQMFFEKLLPYAIAFGVEKIWAKRFSDVELKQPTWYQSYDSARTFNSTAFVSSLQSGLSTVYSTVSTTSSTTRFSSGFSSGYSGGSSGGGGGGGGGSW